MCAVRGQSARAPASIHAAMRALSTSVICVTLPSGIARDTTACSRIAAAWATICAAVSSTTPFGGDAMPSHRGCSAWHVAQRAAMIGCTSRSATRSFDDRPCGRDRDGKCQRAGGRQQRDRPRGAAAMAQVEEMPDVGCEQQQAREHEPRVRMPERHRVVIADHRQQHGQREVVVVHRPLLAAHPVDRVGRARRAPSPRPACAATG